MNTHDTSDSLDEAALQADIQRYRNPEPPKQASDLEQAILYFPETIADLIFQNAPVNAPVLLELPFYMPFLPARTPHPVVTSCLLALTIIKEPSRARFLLEAGANPNGSYEAKQGTDNYTPLMAACEHAPDLVEPLFKAGAQLRATECRDMLLFAAQHNPAVLPAFLKAGAFVNNGVTFLTVGTLAPELVPALLQHAPSVSRIGEAPLTTLLETLLLPPPSLQKTLETADKKGFQLEAVKALCRAGATVNPGQLFNKHIPPLIKACIGAPHCVPFLLEHGAKVEGVTVSVREAKHLCGDKVFLGEEVTPLHLAAAMNHPEAVEALIRESAQRDSGHAQRLSEAHRVAEKNASTHVLELLQQPLQTPGKSPKP